MATDTNTKTTVYTPSDLAKTQAKPITDTSGAKPGTHTLQAGDDLWRVATDAGISLESLIELNELIGKKPKVGDVLKLA